MFFPISLSLAALAFTSSVSATVYDITVGDANGDTVFTPEAIVRLLLIPSTFLPS